MKTHKKGISPATLMVMLDTLDLPLSEPLPRSLSLPHWLMQKKGLTPATQHHQVLARWLQSISPAYANRTSIEAAVGRLRSPDLLLYMAHVLGRDVVDQTALSCAVSQAVRAASLVEASGSPWFRVRACAAIRRSYKRQTSRPLGADIEAGLRRKTQAEA